MVTMTNSAAVLADTAAYAAAVEQASVAAAAYYATGESALDDDAYDRLARGIAAYEADHPEEVLAASPTGKVAGGAAVGDVPHTVPMLSLDNVFSAEQFVTWTASLERRIGRPVTAWSVEPKLDGLAVAARYRDGRFERLITRGDGTAGEDVSHAAGAVVGLPERLAEPVTIEVRGEILMTNDQFDQGNAIRTEHGGAPFANPRNGAAGTLRAKDRAYRVETTFFAYGALPLPDSGELGETLAELPHSEVLSYVAGLGVHTAAGTDVAPVLAATVEEVQARVDAIGSLRAALPFGIDGIVIKADLAADQREAGSGTRAPRWAIAYKLPAVEKITRLLSVEWNVGRTGIIAPRAVLEPVVIDGSTVGYATLHNPADITRRDLRLGDQVMVYKAGDIIPRIEAPVVHLRTGDETPIDFPENCPQCGSDIDTSEQRWRCTRGRNCRLVASVSYAAGRDQLDIEGLGATRVVQLVDAGLVADFADLFTLEREQLLALDRMGETSTDNLLAAIETARTRPLSRVFCALGVRGTGRSMSRRIARYFATMDRIVAADVETLQRVDGIGKEKAAAVVAELVELAPLIDKLVAAGVSMTEPGATPPPEPGTEEEAAAGAGAEAVGDAATGSTLPLAGMTVVVTGAMSGALEKLSRNQMNELIERAGGKSSSSVSQRTSLLVAGEKAGSKRTKAEDLGIRIAVPEEFAELVGAFLAAGEDA
ncbi:NAD-dependent DNA ligase LigA [Streptomyces rubiginosohelvolus]|uniref:NAD-dependent DNA ligase LigA n=1 Tax=unclassified Streptomyces TaxID=2593676 RepID=UPI001909DA4E|nr:MULTISPECIES: NAD-dependent DNA ligase LigA [unclassified Streptomyces]MBK3528349.1 NAD-dependent DNA ligase LigA [Streptomyces sp. MBT72]MBK3536750.1 NAD-dependent DNA ligase LigA [Streptomyces sp. MBT67]MBK3549255.1 NAD-dependent DNA ligase LigA [Streptomyces sp. MBT61]MBK6027077.1 NAD-dependent DNA ligase LigA [Streptomyces sp. MBT59]